MAKYKYILTVIIILFTITTYAQPAQYTPMTAAGYQMKRLKVDSTLHLPSFCGVPTLRNSTAKDGALAIDTCGAILYMWSNQGGWDTVNTTGGGGGGATDTTSLSNRINQRIDSIRRSGDSIFVRKNGVFVFQYKNSAGTTPTLQQVTDSGSTTTNGISVAGLSLGPLGNGLDIVGNTNQLAIRNGGTADNLLEINYGATGSLKFGGGTYPYVEISNSSAGNVNLIAPSTGGTIPISVNGYTANSAGAITIPTGGVAVDTIYRTLGKDSIFYKKNGITYSIKDSVGGGGSSQNGRFGNDTATVVMVKVHNESGTILTNGKVVAFSHSGTQSNEPAVRLANNKHDSTSANTLGFVSGTIAINDTGWVILSGKIEKLNTSAYSNGDIIYLDSINGLYTNVKPIAPYHMVYLGVVVKSNAGNGSIFVKVQNGYELYEIHDVKITSALNNQVLAYSDTQKVWKNRNIYSIVDTVSLSNRINLKLNSADTASLSNRINLKLNITDTTVFQRKSLSANTIMANNTASTANATAQAFKDTSGTYNGTIIWTGTTAPTGATNHSFRLTQVGKCVTLHIALVYATNGVGLSSLQMTLPAGAPTPVQPAGLTGSIFNMYPVSSQIVSSVNQLISGSGTRGYLRNNTAANGFEIFLTFSTAAPGQAGVIVQYWTN